MWPIRVLLLVVAAGLAVLLLTTRGAAEPEDPIREVRGTTADGRNLVLKFDRASGELRSFDVVLDGRCSTGEAVSIHWRPSDGGAPARFVRRGAEVDAREESAGRDAAGTHVRKAAVMSARVTSGRATGTFSFDQRFDYRGGRSIVCRSDRIDWSVPVP